MKSTVSRHTRIHVDIELEDAEAIGYWPGFAHQGKQVQPERMTFEVSRTDGQRDYVGRLTVKGRVYRKDGELGAHRTEMTLFQWHEHLRQADEVLEERLRPLLAVARAEAQQVLRR